MQNKLHLSKTGYYLTGVFLYIILILFDQLTKLLAIDLLQNHGPYILIDKVLEFHYIENRGIAFGLFQGKTMMFAVIACVFTFVFAWLYIKIPKQWKYFPLLLINLVMAAGAMGNLLDRSFRGYVVDFIYFKCIRFPVFNIADIYVVCSCIALVVMMLFYYKEEDLYFIKRNL